MPLATSFGTRSGTGERSDEGSNVGNAVSRRPEVLAAVFIDAIVEAIRRGNLGVNRSSGIPWSGEGPI